MEDDTKNSDKEKLIFFQSIADNVPDMIFVKEAKELRFVFFNKAGEKLLGYKKEDMLGKNDYDFFPKKEADGFIEEDRRALAGKKLVISEDNITTKSGEVRHLYTKKIPILDEKGVPIYLSGISEDVTEKKNLEAELLKHAEERAVEIAELERMNKIMIGRELKMAELKKEIEELKKKIAN